MCVQTSTRYLDEMAYHRYIKCGKPAILVSAGLLFGGSRGVFVAALSYTCKIESFP